MSKDLVSSVGRHKSWVAYPYFYDHALVVLQFDDSHRHIAFPFKLNPIWLGEKGFNEVVQVV